MNRFETTVMVNGLIFIYILSGIPFMLILEPISCTGSFSAESRMQTIGSKIARADVQENINFPTEVRVTSLSFCIKCKYKMRKCNEHNLAEAFALREFSTL